MPLFRSKAKATFVDKFFEFVEAHPQESEVRKGLTPAQIEELEHALGARLPEELAALLQKTNGASLFGRLVDLYGRHLGGPPHEFADLVKTTKRLRSENLIPADRFAFGKDGNGSAYVAEPFPGKRVWLYDFEAGEEHLFRSFTEWLEDELKNWSDEEE